MNVEQLITKVLNFLNTTKAKKLIVAVIALINVFAMKINLFGDKYKFSAFMEEVIDENIFDVLVDDELATFALYIVASMLLGAIFMLLTSFFKTNIPFKVVAVLNVLVSLAFAVILIIAVDDNLGEFGLEYFDCKSASEFAFDSKKGVFGFNIWFSLILDVLSVFLIKKKKNVAPAINPDGTVAQTPQSKLASTLVESVSSIAGNLTAGKNVAYCPNCGQKVAGNLNFCDKCGTKIIR